MQISAKLQRNIGIEKIPTYNNRGELTEWIQSHTVISASSDVTFEDTNCLSTKRVRAQEMQETFSRNVCKRLYK